MWGLNFDEKEKHSSWLFSYALIGKLLGPDMEVEELLVLKKTELTS